MKKYFIQHNQYFDGSGVPSKPYFTIYEKKRFMGWVPYKKYVSETIGDMSGSYKSTISFTSEESAEVFVRDILCEGVKRESTMKFTIKVMECTENI